MDRLDDFRLFLRVLELGSISAAARSLDISVAVASQRLQRLETGLGVRLLHRTTRRLHPTTEGARLAEQGRALIEDLDALTSGLGGRADQVSGVLRVSASASFGQQYVAPLLPGFLARYPQLDMCLELDDRYVDLVGGGIDVAIRIGELADSTLVSRKLADNHRVLCASPGYLRRRGVPATPADLAAHDCLLLVGRDGRQDVWQLGDGAGATLTVPVSGRFESNLGQALRDAALGDLGIALHSLWHVHADLQEGRLQQVLPGYAPVTTAIHAVIPQRRFVPARVRAFIDFLAGQFSPPPWQQALERPCAAPAARTPTRGSGNS